MRVEPITRAHVEAFVPTMENRDELERLTGRDAVTYIAEAAEQSAYTFAGVTADGPIFIGGVRGVPHHTYGAVWMLGGPRIDRAKKFYLRATRAQVDHMLTMFDRLFTSVDARYPKSLRWLRWLGFTVGIPLVKADGRTVHIVEIER